MEKVDLSTNYENIVFKNIPFANSIVERFELPQHSVWHDKAGLIRLLKIEFTDGQIRNLALVPKDNKNEELLNLLTDGLSSSGIKWVGSKLFSGHHLITNIGHFIFDHYGKVLIKDLFKNKATGEQELVYKSIEDNKVYINRPLYINEWHSKDINNYFCIQISVKYPVKLQVSPDNINWNYPFLPVQGARIRTTRWFEPMERFYFYFENNNNTGYIKIIEPFPSESPFFLKYINVPPSYCVYHIIHPEGNPLKVAIEEMKN